MPLRCLLFSSDEGLVQPIWQALSDLGIDGEYCQSAVDAVERVTTQLFQIVITDWEDQPEAAFLLKTARDLKAAHRPLTLAIVNDAAGLPEALKAGANSVLLKPIRTEQVRDTMRTACELLRAKIPASTIPASTKSIAPATSPGKPEQIAMAAAAASASGASAIRSSKRTPEISFRAGEFLQSASSAPGAQSDTESEVQEDLDQIPGEEVDSLTELEPTAAAVRTGAAVDTDPEPAQAGRALTGWAALQARLGKAEPPPATEMAPQNQILSYEETISAKEAATLPAENGNLPKTEAQGQSQSEAVLFNYMAGKSQETAQPKENRPGRGRFLLLGAFAVLVMVSIAIPQTRQIWGTCYQTALKTGEKWLNPPPTRVAQVAVQHDSFAHAGDEYQMPAAGKVSDAVTDGSQIHVLPVVDPTAKPAKSADSNNGTAQSAVESPDDQNSFGQRSIVQGQADGQREEVNSTGDPDARQITLTPAISPSSRKQTEPNSSANKSGPSTASVAASARSYWQPTAVSAGKGAGIPSSLRSQVASMTPESSGSKPVDAAMSSIEPVKLPETTTRELLAQSVNPQYPEAAKGSGQGGSVTLQVVIGHDGVVQDAKFLQGSLVFARAAIEAVRQWRFKPYSLNGRVVSIQSTITLNFKPSA